MEETAKSSSVYEDTFNSGGIIGAVRLSGIHKTFAISLDKAVSKDEFLSLFTRLGVDIADVIFK